MPRKTSPKELIEEATITRLSELEELLEPSDENVESIMQRLDGFKIFYADYEDVKAILEYFKDKMEADDE